MLALISWYSAGVWRFINEYFRYEYKEYLSGEFKRNKHLQLNSEIPTQMPSLDIVEELSPDNFKPFTAKEEVKACKTDSHHPSRELDYYNQLKTNDRESQEDDGFLSHWLGRRKPEDNADHNLHCRASCEDNAT